MQRVTRLAATLFGAPFASVTIVTEPRSPNRTWVDAAAAADRHDLAEAGLCRYVIESAEMLIIEDTRMNPPAMAGRAGASRLAVAWAGVPVRDQDGHVAGALCVADHLPRRWSEHDVDVLAALALVASGEAALQLAMEQGSEDSRNRRLARLPSLPGLRLAARCLPARPGAELAGIFYDVVPAAGGRWGLLVGEVSGQVSIAARSIALARRALAAQAREAARPSAILAGLNQEILDWPAADRRLLAVICAIVRPSLAGTIVQVSSAGRTGALVRRADGSMHTLGQPGALLGLRPDPDLRDSRRLLRAGDSLILVSDSVTDACGPAEADPLGADRLRQVVAGLGGGSAARAADDLLRAAAAFSGGQIGGDAVALVLKVPGNKPGPGAHAAAWPGTQAYQTVGARDAPRSRPRRKALCGAGGLPPVPGGAPDLPAAWPAAPPSARPGQAGHSRRPPEPCPSSAITSATSAMAVMAIAVSSTRLAAARDCPGALGSRPIRQITALKSRTGAPAAGRDLSIAIPTAANEIAVRVQASSVRSRARTGSASSRSSGGAVNGGSPGSTGQGRRRAARSRRSSRTGSGEAGSGRAACHDEARAGCPSTRGN